jgi:hypothetical protein
MNKKLIELGEKLRKLETKNLQLQKDLVRVHNENSAKAETNISLDVIG